MGVPGELVHLVPISRSSSEYLNPCPCGLSQVSFLILSSLDHTTCMGFSRFEGWPKGSSLRACGQSLGCHMYVYEAPRSMEWSQIWEEKKETGCRPGVCGEYGFALPPQNLRESEKSNSELSLLDCYKSVYAKIGR